MNNEEIKIINKIFDTQTIRTVTNFTQPQPSPHNLCK